MTKVLRIDHIGPWPYAKVCLGAISLEWYFSLQRGCHYDLSGPTVDDMPDDALDQVKRYLGTSGICWTGD